MTETDYELEQEIRDRTLIVRVSGKFDQAAGEAVVGAFSAGDADAYVLTLSGVNYCSSSGIAAMVKLTTDFKVRIAAPAACVIDVLSLAGIERVLSIHADEQAACETS